MVLLLLLFYFIFLVFVFSIEKKVLVTQSGPTLCSSMTGICQAPLSMEFSRQEYWSGLIFHCLGDLPDPRIEPGSPKLQADSLPSEPAAQFCIGIQSILKSRDITLPAKVHLVKAMVFPVVMYGCESWSVKKAERRKIDAFEVWCWRRLLRVPWTARRSNQSILKEISPGCSLEGLMLKLKLQYFGHLM